MDATTENSIRQEQIESFGRLMAGFSHDMKNHLGIIRESNGLMDDIIAMGGCGEDEMSVERLRKSISAIERRVAIAAKMFHHLSGFAHRPDTPQSSFHINDLVTEECIFLERFSKLRQINFILKTGEGLSAIYNDPALLQHVVYRVYILSLDQLDSGDTLTIITGQNEKNAEITFRLGGSSQLSPENLSESHLMPAITKLEGTLKMGESTKDYTEIILTIPSLPVA
ncbi:MAG: hypothetical protein U9P36_13115 [Thermodesulfobacteriota bacterium]|nr:hypothetical protein [Thermodesulfobacteriota bacterium]